MKLSRKRQRQIDEAISARIDLLRGVIEDEFRYGRMPHAQWAALDRAAIAASLRISTAVKEVLGC